MNKKRCHTLLPLVQLLPAVAAAAAVLFALPRTVPVLAAVPEKLTTVVEQPVEAASSEAEEETLPKLPYADGVYLDFGARRFCEARVWSYFNKFTDNGKSAKPTRRSTSGTWLRMTPLGLPMHCRANATFS